MATYRRTEIVEAEQYDGPDLIVMHDQLGEQHAHKGDWLLGKERGHIQVMTDERFKADFAPYTATAAEVKASAKAAAEDEKEDAEYEKAAPLREHPVSQTQYPKKK
jgi:hypothetical protein